MKLLDKLKGFIGSTCSFCNNDAIYLRINKFHTSKNYYCEECYNFRCHYCGNNVELNEKHLCLTCFQRYLKKELEKIDRLNKINSIRTYTLHAKIYHYCQKCKIDIGNSKDPFCFKCKLQYEKYKKHYK